SDLVVLRREGDDADLRRCRGSRRQQGDGERERTNDGGGEGWVGYRMRMMNDAVGVAHEPSQGNSRARRHEGRGPSPALPNRVRRSRGLEEHLQPQLDDARVAGAAAHGAVEVEGQLGGLRAQEVLLVEDVEDLE